MYIKWKRNCPCPPEALRLEGKGSHVHSRLTRAMLSATARRAQWCVSTEEHETNCAREVGWGVDEEVIHICPYFRGRNRNLLGKEGGKMHERQSGWSCERAWLAWGTWEHQWEWSRMTLRWPASDADWSQAWRWKMTHPVMACGALGLAVLSRERSRIRMEWRHGFGHRQ